MSKKRLIKLFIWIVLGYFLVAFFTNGEKVYQFSFEKEDLKKIVTPYLSQEGKYAVYIRNLSTGETFSQNDTEEFKSGSLYKLWVMSAVFEQVKQGKIKEEDQLVADVAALNKKFDLDGEEAEFRQGRIEFSVSSALKQMITISHNYAALALLDKVGSTSISNKVTAKDTAEFLKKVYKGEMIDQEYSRKMMDLLTGQTINDRIPKYLPEGTRVAHKTGDIGFFEHDAGIVFSPGADFIIVVLSETEDPAQAGDTIAKISLAAFDYFNR